MLRASDIGNHSPHNIGNENDLVVRRARWLNDSFPGLLLPDQVWGEAIKASRLWEEWSPTGLVQDPVFCHLLHNGDRLKKVLGWWRVRDPGWQWTLDCRDPKPDNQIND